MKPKYCIGRSLRMMVLLWRLLLPGHLQKLSTVTATSLPGWHDSAQSNRDSSVFNPVQRPCQVIVACNGERLGNAFVNAMLAMHVALQWRTELVVDSMCWGYNDLFGDMDKGTVLEQRWDFSTMPRKPSMGPLPPCNGTYFSNVFTPQHMPSLTPTARQLRHMAITHLYPRLQWGASTREHPLQVPDVHDLVIYLRSGDIWGHMLHPTYVQAPCTYLDAVIKHAQVTPAHIKVVTDTISTVVDAGESHPCGRYVIDKYPGAQMISSTAQGDWGYLMHARSLVITGVSSFSATAAYLNPWLKRLYSFGWTPQQPPLPGQDLPENLTYYMANRAIALPQPPWPNLQYVVFLVFAWLPRWNMLERQALHTAAVEHGQANIRMLSARAPPDTLHEDDAQFSYYLPHFTFTQLLGCSETAQTTATTLMGTRRPMHPWAPHRGLFPAIAFVPSQEWVDVVLPLLHQEQRFITSLVYVQGHTTRTNPSVEWPMPSDTPCQVPPLVETVRSAFYNPFGTSHFVWMANPNNTYIMYDKVLEWLEPSSSKPLLLVDHLDMHYQPRFPLTRWLENGGDNKERLPANITVDIIGLVIPSARHSPALMHELWHAVVQRSTQPNKNTWLSSWFTLTSSRSSNVDQILDICRLIECSLQDVNWVEVLSRPSSADASGVGGKAKRANSNNVPNSPHSKADRQPTVSQKARKGTQRVE